MRREFQSPQLNDEGLARVERTKEAFSTLLTQLAVLVPSGREFSIVRTKLEEAAFFAVLGIEVLPRYQV